MSINDSGLNVLNLNATAVASPLAKLALTGTVGSDLIIPEHVSDSAKILKTDCEIKIQEMVAANNSVTVRGTAFVTALLLGEDGSLSSVKTSESFELKDFLEGSDENTVLIYGGATSNCNSRLVNPRKINLSSEINVNICALQGQNVSPTIKGTETIDDEASLRRKRGNIAFTDSYSISDNDIPVSHDVLLDGNLPPMSEIVYYNVRVRPSEVITAGSNVIVKSKAIFDGIYKSEEGNMFPLERQFMIERSLEADDAESYDWFANATASDISAEIAIDNYGDAKLLELDFTYDLRLNGVRNVIGETVTDAYSTEHACETKNNQVITSIYKRTFNTSLSVNASADRTQIAAENVRNIMLGSVTVNSVSSEYSEEKKRLIIDATAVISAVCEVNITSESDSKFSSLSFEYPFKCELDVGEMQSNTIYDIKITSTEKRFRCDQNKIYCDFENDIKAIVSESCINSYLSEIDIQKNTTATSAHAPITLCYPTGGESLWDIAKYYKVTVEAIIASNKLDGEDITDRKVLLIPSYRRSAPLFTKVI